MGEKTDMRGRGTSSPAGHGRGNDGVCHVTGSRGGGECGIAPGWYCGKMAGHRQPHYPHDARNPKSELSRGPGDRCCRFYARLVVVGTGTKEFKKLVGEIDKAWLGTWAANIPEMLMQDASWQNRLILQWLSQSQTAEPLDREIGNMDGDLFGGKPLLTYLRYNFTFSEKNLNALDLGKVYDAEAVNEISDMAKAKNKKELYEIGYKTSSVIKPEHFSKF